MALLRERGNSKTTTIREKINGKIDDQERETLSERVRVYEGYVEKLNDCLLRNEQLLTSMDSLNAAVSEIGSSVNSDREFTAALKDLDKLTIQASSYHSS